MNKLLRFRFLNKLAQTTPAAPTVAPVVLSPPTNVPNDLFSHLATGYNGGTVALLTGLTNQLNVALHYASQGQDNFQDIINNNMDLSGAAPDQKNVGMISQKLYNTFLNRKNPFNKKISPQDIHTWADTIINSPETNNLTQIKPTSTLATKLQGNLKTTIVNYLNQIKQQNPIIT